MLSNQHQNAANNPLYPPYFEVEMRRKVSFQGERHQSSRAALSKKLQILAKERWQKSCPLGMIVDEQVNHKS
jgi:hypothetical protein